MSKYKKVSVAVIKRLPRYYRYLFDLIQTSITKISSTELSKKMGVTASQIRQDLNCFGGFGQQGYGYNVESLFGEVSSILGVNKTFNCVIIGAGNMGRSLALYPNFNKRGFKTVGIFDNASQLIGTEINGLKVMSMEELTSEYVRENDVEIAMLAVPFAQTREVAECAVDAGIKGLWNFSPMDLNLTHDVVIENVHLSDSLMVLGYRLNQKYRKNLN